MCLGEMGGVVAISQCVKEDVAGQRTVPNSEAGISCLPFDTCR